MPGTKTNFLETLILNCVLRGSTFPTFSTVYLSMHTADPTETGSLAAEVGAGVGYSRKAVTCNTTNWSAPADVSGLQTTLNAVVQTFANPSGNWGTITHVGINDASTAGNMLWVLPLDTSRTIVNGDNAPSFAINALSIGEG